ncbi:MAG: putative transcriptional regulator with domain containing protein [Firmicutes bacterium]|nr:putative transcriptional regulator with domain containing protein [Bacillota bacterium]
MEDRFKMSILLDLYGTLLTDKQRDILNLYYNDDLSLAEIAENMETSRQAVFDIIKRCHKILLEYESRLGLMQKEISRENSKGELLGMLDGLAEGSRSGEISEIRSFVIENL